MAELKFIENPETLRTLAPVAVAPIRHHVFVCTGKSCSAVDSAAVKEAFEDELKQRGVLFGKEAKGKNPHGSIVVTECASVGFCAIGAAVMVYPDGVWYAQVRASDVPEIIETHLFGGRVVERLALMKVPCATDSVKKSQADSNVDWEA
jgi:(2Fe-2S) ferredoxin